MVEDHRMLHRRHHDDHGRRYSGSQQYIHRPTCVHRKFHSCLNLGPNSYVFDGANALEPTLAGATGLIYVNDNNSADTSSLFRILDGHPEGITVGVAGSSLTPSDTFCAVITIGTVTTIPLPYPNFSGIIYLAITQNVTFATGGNIAAGLSATPGQLVTAAYSKTQAKWYLK